MFLSLMVRFISVLGVLFTITVQSSIIFFFGCFVLLVACLFDSLTMFYFLGEEPIVLNKVKAVFHLFEQ